MAAVEQAEALARAPLIAVCVCTRARPRMLRRCLISLQKQKFDLAQMNALLIVVDNDPEPSARATHAELCDGAHGYVHCPRPGIPVARNAAIEAALSAGADYIAFIDDDEVAPEHWLASMMHALQRSGADAVQGGVRKAPCGVEDLATCAPTPSEAIRWEDAESLATCNVLFKASLVEGPRALRFDESMQFTGGSDREFFMRANRAGAKTMRVHGVDVLEEVCAGRAALSYECGRAFASGHNYFVRMVKNETPLVAAARIGLRAISSALGAVGKFLAGTILYALLQADAGAAKWRKACANMCFAAGCLAPVIGVRAEPYRVIQGA